MDGKDARNGRVATAVLATKLDAMMAMLTELNALLRADHDRIGRLEGEIGRLDTRITSTSKALGQRIDRTNDKVNALQGVQIALTTIAAAIAGWLGVRH